MYFVLLALPLHYNQANNTYSSKNIKYKYLQEKNIWYLKYSMFV